MPQNIPFDTSLKSVELIPIYEEYRYRELLMAAILKNGCHLGFLGGYRTDLFSIPYGVITPILVLVSPFARLCCIFAFICPAKNSFICYSLNSLQCE